jgi:arginyl-tRNA synthetase
MTIRQEIANLIDTAARTAQAAGDLPQVALPEAAIERPSRPEHGDYASNLALRLTRAANSNPIGLAEAIIRHLPATRLVESATVAPPGFINIRLDEGWLAAQVEAIEAAGPAYADSKVGGGRRVQVEFVSANPVGPLTVGNGRWASLGDTLARVLAAAGYAVEREYLINDAGTQVDTFAQTVFARYQQLFGRDVAIPPDGYPGEYVVELATAIKDELGDRFLADPAPSPELRRLAVDRMVARIRDDMAAMGVVYDVWFSESSLYEGDTYREAMDLLRQQGAVMEREGAVWFTSSALGEEKDNVLIRSTGSPTYFASDIAYHYDKLVKRSFDRVIDVWGADHQGHVSRLKTAVAALGIAPERLEIIIGQLVTLKRGGETVRLSKRAGEIVTLREVVEEVGKDACRFFFLQRSADAQMDFDVELAKRQSAENPVYYVQYAHARIASVLSQAAERGLSPEGGNTALLRHPAELALVRRMLLLPDLVESIAESREPHHLPYYAMDLATAFHDFYERCRVIDDGEPELTRARLRLAAAARIALGRSLELIGVSAPERM